MFRRLMKHTLYGVSGVAYSFVYDALPTFLKNIRGMGILNDDEIPAVQYEISAERMLAYCAFAVCLSASHDYLYPHREAGFLERRRTLINGKTPAQKLDEMGSSLEKVPEHLVDEFIGKEMYSDPVFLLGDGITYEREDIENWLSRNDSSPAFGQKLSGSDLCLISNIGKRRELDAYVNEQVLNHRLKQNARQIAELQDVEPEYEVRVAVLR